MRRAAIAALTMTIVWTTTAAVAELASKADGESITANAGAKRTALDRLQATFTNFTFEEFGPSEVPGLYTAFVNGRPIYYVPGEGEGEDYLIFGQVFTADGVDLTAAAIQRHARKRMAGLDLAVAVPIGSTDPSAIEIIEFTNPDCGFCRALDKYLRSRAEEGAHIRRRIVFSTTNGQSRAKAIHVLCADDADAAFAEIYAGKARDLNRCAEGEAALEAHLTVSAEAGVTGTPTLLLDGKAVTGFRQGEVEAFLQSKAATTMKVSGRNSGD